MKPKQKIITGSGARTAAVALYSDEDGYIRKLIRCETITD